MVFQTRLRLLLQIAKENTLPNWTGFENILISGMGGSAIAGDLLAAYLAKSCPLPIFSHRDYGIPAWVSAEKTLVIACSHSGNTEETLSTFEAAKTLGCRIVAVTTGGKLAAATKAAGFPVWIFNHTGQPRSAVGFGFVLLISILSKLGLIPNPETGFSKRCSFDAQGTSKISTFQPGESESSKEIGRAICRTEHYNNWLWSSCSSGSKMERPDK